MFSSLLFTIFSNLIYFALHVTHAGSFPRPLSAAEERECLDKFHNGDLEARNKLIEHNLRLVAHIIKKYFSYRLVQRARSRGGGPGHRKTA